MKKMAAAQFKARCLAVMDSVNKTREAVVITKRGRPVAKLVPVDDEPKEFLGSLEGIVKIMGDIESPVDPPSAWNVR
jgi:prevent-host-death family protein